ALEGAAGREKASGKKLCGIFGGKGGQFEFYEVADRPASPRLVPGNSENPTLAECTKAALEVLTEGGNSKAGSFLMIEQGDIDWANHANAFPQMIGGVHDLDEAVKAAVAFVERSDSDAVDWSNTLILVTADHSNSYMRLHAILGKGDLPAVDAGGRPKDGSVSYSTTHHTNEPVSLYARGMGTQLFRECEGSWYKNSALIDNTQIFWTMVRALGLRAPTTAGQEAPLVPLP
ncbi:MAG: alkaline phosphatase, partial [Planctomycetes bacterium]|nr:alkaline phosphatase [Planctomycetota bacterium]